MADPLYPLVTFTGKDVQSLDDEFARVLPEYFPEVNALQEQNNPGRRFFSLMEGLVAGLHYTLNFAWRETFMATAQLKTNVARIAKGLGYYAEGYLGALVDITFLSKTGALGVDTPIAQYTQVNAGSPAIPFITIEDGTLAAGETSVVVTAVQGSRIESETVGVSDASARQRMKLTYGQVDHRYVTVYVGATEWTVDPDHGADQSGDSEMYWLEIDDQNYTWIVFGDNVRGKIPPSGSAITVDYIITAGESGNEVEPNKITAIQGALSAILNATNYAQPSGGQSLEDRDSIKARAASSEHRRDRYVNATDYVTGAEAILGVYSAYASQITGRAIQIGVMGVGGSDLPQTVLDDVDYELSYYGTLGASPSSFNLDDAAVIAAIEIRTLNSKVSKTTLRAQALAAIRDSLRWDVVRPGYGPGPSDFDAMIRRDLKNSSSIDEAEVTMMSRKARIEKSDSTLPDLILPVRPTTQYDWVQAGNVWISRNTQNGDILLTVLNATSFQVSVYGTVKADGTIGTVYTDDESQICLRVGVPGDLFTSSQFGETYTFRTSKRLGVVYLSDTETPILQYNSDIQISVLYPGE